MATMLECYTASKNNFDNGMQIAIPGPAQIWQHQEILYRIEVLEACQMFIKTAPRTVNTGELLWHYQMVDAYFQNLSLERRFGIAVDEHRQQQRDTAHKKLMLIIQDYRRRFGSFSPGSDANYYHMVISKIVQTVLPIWIQYRQTYIEIIKEAA